ncbi:MAG: MBL fold metallo-hydrolase, partial [Verrucomicrobiota bacterium]
MIQPFRKDNELIDDIENANGDTRCFHAWWLGQSGFLIKWGKWKLLFDPYLSDSLTRKYAQSDKPHVRMTELVVDPGRLTGLEVITSSHNHTDHLDK